MTRDASMLFDEIAALVTASLRGDLADEETARLESLIATDSKACDLYLDIIYDSQNLLTWAGGRESVIRDQESEFGVQEGRRHIPCAVTEVGSACRAEPDATVWHPAIQTSTGGQCTLALQAPARQAGASPQSAFRIPHSSFLARHPLMFSLFVSTVATVLLLVTAAQIRMGNPFSEVARPDGSRSKPIQLVARFTEGSDCSWADDSDAPSPGGHAWAGQVLDLREGVAELTFRNGAVALIEGPAVFVPEGEGVGRLDRGKLLARIEGKASGFTIHTPAASVVDLGTEFAVDVAANGDTDVYVLKGKVELTRAAADSDQPEPFDRTATLVAGEAMRVTASGRKPMARIAENAFQMSAAMRSLVAKPIAATDVERPKTEPHMVVWLGNLFDDPKGTPLHEAMRTDTFRAVADDDNLGVERVLYGGHDPVKLLCPEVRFDLTSLGWQHSRFGNVTNDTYLDLDQEFHERGGISTRGSKIDDFEPKIEEGIGAHANSLITFELDEIRAAGGLEGKSSEFVCDRAGINDSVMGDYRASVYMAAIISDSTGVRTVVVNGRQVQAAKQNGAWSITSHVGFPLYADGTFAAFRVPIPANARYLTLVSASASDNNHYDQAVWSGARLEVSE